jgi:aminoglycoside phosphotransferase (APT) family kinase protein
VTGDYPPELAAVRPGDALNWDLVASYLQSHLDGLGPLEAVWQFPNGSANLNYLLEFADRRLVIRRPPFGELAIGAHDMKREYRARCRGYGVTTTGPRVPTCCARTTPSPERISSRSSTERVKLCGAAFRPT